MIYELMEIIGYFTLVLVVLAISSFIIKKVNVRLIKIIPHKYKKIRKLYFKVSSLIIKYHKYIGITAFLFMIIHGVIALYYLYIPISGIVLFITMLGLLLSGIYKGFVNKNSNIKLIHGILAIIAIISIAIHIY